MSSDLLLVYISRVLDIILPSEAGLDIIRVLNDSLIKFVDAALSRRRDIELEISTSVRSLLEQKGWPSARFEILLQDIDRLTSLDSIVDYLRTVINDLDQVRMSDPIKDTHLPSLAFNIGTGFANLRSSPIRSNDNLVSTLSEIIKPYYKTTSDETVIQFLPYALLGVDSQLFILKDDSVLIPPRFNNSYASLLNQILEPGLLFRKLKDMNSTRSHDTSAIKRLFASFLNTELTGYSAAVNSIFQKKPSSLISVYKELHPRVVPLRFLYSLTEKLSLPGDELLALVYRLTKFGDLEVSRMANKLFQMMALPYYEMTEQWLLKGLLIDTLNEFFISFDSLAQTINEIIQFSSQKVPPFLTGINKNLGYRIFHVGKMIIFLDKYCKELEWLNSFTGHYTNTICSAKGLASTNGNQFVQIVGSMYHELLNYMTHVIFDKYELLTHLLHYKKFLFMEANDFIEQIIGKGTEVFDEPSISLTSGQLARILVDSIKTSSVKTLDIQYQSRLDARILELSHGSIGWEVFTLEYRVTDLPINNILTAYGGMTNYLKAFNFLWKMRHFTSILNTSFIESCNLKRNDLKLVNRRYSQLKQHMKQGEFLMNLRDRRTYWIIKTFNVVNVVRHEMLALLGAIVYYLSYDVIEDSYQRKLMQKFLKTSAKSSMSALSNSLHARIADFQNQTTDANGRSRQPVENNVHEYNLDELVDIHTSYLLSIVNSRLLNGDIIGKISGRSFITQIYLFLDMIFQFSSSWDQFAILLVNYVGIVSLEKGLTEKSPNSEDVMDLDDDMERNEESLQILSHKIYTDLYLGQFKPLMETFVLDLRADNELRTLGRSL